MCVYSMTETCPIKEGWVVYNIFAPSSGFIGYDEMRSIKGGFSCVWKHVLHISVGLTWSFHVDFRISDGK